MNNRKMSSLQFFPTAVGASLAITVTFVIAVLVDAVVGMHSYL